MSDPALAQPLPGQRAALRSRWLAYALAIAVIVVLPFVFTDTYWRTNLTVCAINVLLAIGLDFILGYAGQLNLGHSAFYGLGAYVSTLLIVKLGIPFWIAFVAGVAFAGIAGTFLSLFAVRLRGHYLAIASLGFAVIVHQILLNWISLTQGPLGIYGIAPPPAIVIGGVVIADFRNLAAFFYLVAGFAFLSYILLSQLVRSPIGETLTAIREDEVSAASLGINGAAWKVFAFGVGSAVAGAAGCFYASFVGTLVPDAFFVSEAFNILAMVIVGGMGTLIGPVFGAILLTVLPEVLRGFGDLRLVVYGAALTFVVLFMPGGLAQAGPRCRRKTRPEALHMSAAAATAATAQPLLQAQGLHKNFGGVKAVSDISFAVPAGSIFAVIGPNGAGKSTLLNLISGVYQANAGSLSFKGSRSFEDARAPARAARHCANVPEDSPVQAAQRAGERDRRLSHPSQHPGLAICGAWRGFCRGPAALPRAGGKAARFRRHVGADACGGRLAVLRRAAHARAGARACDQTTAFADR